MVELDFYWDEPPSDEAPWRLGGTTGKVPSASKVPPKFDVVVTNLGEKKIQVMHVVASALGIGVKEAKALLEERTKTLVKETVGREEADALKAEVEGAGGEAELRLAGTSGPVT